MKTVTAAIIVHNHKVLIAQRKHGKNLEYFWEFPGGKLEKGETLPQCLKREISEELRLDISVGNFFMESRYEYDFGTISLHAFWASCAGEEINFMDSHEQIRWVSCGELDQYTFAPADRPIVRKLQETGF